MWTFGRLLLTTIVRPGPASPVHLWPVPCHSPVTFSLGRRAISDWPSAMSARSRARPAATDSRGRTEPAAATPTDGVKREGPPPDDVAAVKLEVPHEGGLKVPPSKQRRRKKNKKEIPYETRVVYFTESAVRNPPMRETQNGRKPSPASLESSSSRNSTKRESQREGSPSVLSPLKSTQRNSPKHKNQSGKSAPGSSQKRKKHPSESSADKMSGGAARQPATVVNGSQETTAGMELLAAIARAGNRTAGRDQQSADRQPNQQDQPATSQQQNNVQPKPKPQGWYRCMLCDTACMYQTNTHKVFFHFHCRHRSLLLIMLECIIYDYTGFRSPFFLFQYLEKKCCNKYESGSL